MQHLRLFCFLLPVLINLCSALFAQNQTPITANVISTQPGAPASPSVAYRHFFHYVAKLNKTTRLKEDAPTGLKSSLRIHAKLTDQNIDVISSQAEAFENDLGELDAQAAQIVAAFRARAQVSKNVADQLAPSAVVRLKALQEQRDQLVNQHIMLVQNQLGKTQGARLSNYINREFAPNIKVELIGPSQRPGGIPPAVSLKKEAN